MSAISTILARTDYSNFPKSQIAGALKHLSGFNSSKEISEKLKELLPTSFIPDFNVDEEVKGTKVNIPQLHEYVKQFEELGSEILAMLCVLLIDNFAHQISKNRKAKRSIFGQKSETVQQILPGMDLDKMDLEEALSRITRYKDFPKDIARDLNAGILPADLDEDKQERLNKYLSDQERKTHQAKKKADNDKKRAARSERCYKKEADRLDKINTVLKYSAHVPAPGKKTREPGKSFRLQTDSQIPVLTVRQPAPFEDRPVCPGCGKTMKIHSYVSYDELQYVPSNYILIRTEVPRYSCPGECVCGHNDRMVMASGPSMADSRMFEHSPATSTSVAGLASSLVCARIPLYAQEKLLRESGIRFPRQTMSHQLMQASSEYLLPIIEKVMIPDLRQETVIHMDGVPYTVLLKSDHNSQKNDETKEEKSSKNPEESKDSASDTAADSVRIIKKPHEASRETGSGKTGAPIKQKTKTKRVDQNMEPVTKPCNEPAKLSSMEFTEADAGNIRKAIEQVESLRNDPAVPILKDPVLLASALEKMNINVTDDLLKILTSDAEETSVSEDSKRKNKRKLGKKTYLLASMTGDFSSCPMVIYSYTRSRTLDVVMEVLGEKYSGAVMADGYAVYDEMPDTVTRLQCMVHCRRGIVECLETRDDYRRFKKLLKSEAFTSTDQILYLNEHEALLILLHLLALIGQLYEVELDCAGKSPEEIQKERAENSTPILDKLLKNCEEALNLFEEGGDAYKAIRYIVARKDILYRYINDGVYPLDNNRVEREGIKPAVMVRKECLFANSEDGLRSLCSYLTIMVSARLNDLDPYKYLVYVFEKQMETRPEYWRSMERAEGSLFRDYEYKLEDLRKLAPYSPELPKFLKAGFIAEKGEESFETFMASRGHVFYKLWSLDFGKILSENSNQTRIETGIHQNMRPSKQICMA